MKKYILLLLCCLLIPWSLEAKDLTINLKYTPREKVKVLPKNIPTERIFFEEVEDIRSRPREIGENREDKGKPVKILTSKDDGAGQFTLSVLKNEFQEKGFKVESSPNAASKIISLTLLKFWTLEESRYSTEVQLKVEVREKRREPYFRKTYSSTGTNSGRSLSEVNYNECISNALARMTDQLFSDLEFLRELAERPRPPRVEERRPEEKRVEERRPGERRAEEKRLEEIKSEIKRLEDLKAEERRAREAREAERQAEEKRMEERRVREAREADRRAEEKRLEEKRAREKQEEEKRAEERKAEEKRLEDLKAEVKKLEEIKAIKEEILAEEQRAEEKRAEEKKKEEERRAKEKKSAPAKSKPTTPVFGPK